MDTKIAFILGEINRGKKEMVFDWNKAACLIKERNPSVVEAGLRGDWGWTGGEIFLNGKPYYDSVTFLQSTWAVPEIRIDGETFDCFIMEDECEWETNPSLKWPKSSLKILNS